LRKKNSEYFIDQLAISVQTSTETRMASIHQVILDGRLSQLNLLINKLGCNVNEKDSYGRTPLHLAVLSDQERYGYRVARLLLQGSADINATDSQQQTPLVYACLLSRSKLVALFLRTKSIDWRLADHDSYLIVHHAASSSHPSILAAIVHEMKLLGLSLDCKTEMGYTPLILAIKSSHYENAMFLIDHTDASPFAIDDEYHMTCEQWIQHVEPKLNEWAFYYHRPNASITRRSVDKK
jgi:ankyrin repeat protein